MYSGFWWGTRGKRPFGRPKRRWENNAKMDIQEVGCAGAWTGLIGPRIWTGGGGLGTR